MCPFYSTMSVSTRLSLVLIYLFTAIWSVHIVTTHGSAEYLLWLFFITKNNTVKMARALCPGTSYHEQTVLPSHTCISSVPTQNNDMQLVRNIVKEHRWALHHIEKSMCPPHGIMGRLCRQVKYGMFNALSR